MSSGEMAAHRRPSPAPSHAGGRACGRRWRPIDPQETTMTTFTAASGPLTTRRSRTRGVLARLAAIVRWPLAFLAAEAAAGQLGPDPEMELSRATGSRI